MISVYISFTMSVQILQNLSESINYFCETWSIRPLILTNFTDNITGTKQQTGKNEFETKVKLV